MREAWLVVFLVIGFASGFYFRNVMDYQKRVFKDSRPPMNYRAFSIGEMMHCSVDTPWERNMGGAEFFYINKADMDTLHCKLWMGSPEDLERYEQGRAFKTIDEANRILQKRFARVKGELEIKEVK